MEKEKVGVCARVWARGLKSRGLIEVTQDKKGDYVLFMSKGIRKKWLVFNFPEEMWKLRCTREEVAQVVKDFLAGRILEG